LKRSFVEPESKTMSVLKINENPLDNSLYVRNMKGEILEAIKEWLFCVSSNKNENIMEN